MLIANCRRIPIERIFYVAILGKTPTPVLSPAYLQYVPLCRLANLFHIYQVFDYLCQSVMAVNITQCPWSHYQTSRHVCRILSGWPMSAPVIFHLDPDQNLPHRSFPDGVPPYIPIINFSIMTTGVLVDLPRKHSSIYGHRR